MIAVLAEWLKNPSPRTGPPTWKKVVVAVASRVGGDNPSEARRIGKNFKRTYVVTRLSHDEVFKMCTLIMIILCIPLDRNLLILFMHFSYWNDCQVLRM